MCHTIADSCSGIVCTGGEYCSSGRCIRINTFINSQSSFGGNVGDMFNGNGFGQYSSSSSAFGIGDGLKCESNLNSLSLAIIEITTIFQFVHKTTIATSDKSVNMVDAAAHSVVHSQIAIQIISIQSLEVCLVSGVVLITSKEIQSLDQIIFILIVQAFAVVPSSKTVSTVSYV
jgi:hypothetical protein